MKWVQINKYCMQFGESEWFISKTFNVPYPYQLYRQDKLIGSFATLQEAMDHHIEIHHRTESGSI